MKKLTDEEIVKALECCDREEGDCKNCPYHKKNMICYYTRCSDTLDLIHSLQDENKDLKEERENMQAVIFGLEEEKRQLQKQVGDQKAEIERMTEERDLYKNQFNELEPRFFDMRYEKQELQKQVDNQNAEIERLNKCVMSEVQVRKCCEDIIQDTIKQTVNDMGKEIYKRVTDNLKMWLRERYDVEVK